MAIKTLILGESGTGKSTSLQNFNSDEVCYINPAKKPLPFKGKFEALTGDIDVRNIIKFIKASKKKVIIIDDAQYLMAFQYMHRLRENGWDKYNDIQADFFSLIDFTDELPDDVTVYFLSHIEVKEDGRQKVKTIGKMLDEKITIEGMFTTVLKTYVSDGKYYFLTQNSGMDTVKSPIGMFPTFAIDNDLKYVDEKIRNYYEIGDFKSDEEMKAEDEKVKNDDIQKASKGRVTRRSSGESRSSRRSKDDEPKAAEESTRSSRRTANKSNEEPKEEAAEQTEFMTDGKLNVEDGGDLNFDDVEVETPKPRSRKSKRESQEQA